MNDGKRVVVQLVSDEVVVERDIPLGAGSYSVRFRPVSPVEFRAYQRTVAGASPLSEQLAAEYELAAKLVLDWQLAGEDGQKLPITPATMQKLRPPLFNDLFAVVVFDTGTRLLGESAAS